MEILEKTENQIAWKSEVEDSLANAVRRYISQISVLAIDEVEIFKNDSPLYDETISHRLGLVPLKSDKAINEKSTAQFKLVKKEGVVYSGDLKGNVEIVYDKIPLTLLNKSQELELVATAKAGKGSEHSKFNPGLMYYRNISDVIIGKEFYEKVKSIFPKNDIKDKGDKIIIRDDLKKEAADVCEGLAEEVGKTAEIVPQKGLVIVVESFGQMPVNKILSKSIEALKKDLAEFSKNLK